MRCISGLLFALALALTAAPALSDEAGRSGPYIGLGAGGDFVTNKFGGVNTVGNFLNNDSRFSQNGFVAVRFGIRNGVRIAGVPFTVELEASRGENDRVTSASFPGLPAPTVFYRSRLRTTRLGGNIWREIAQVGGVNLELGLGLGAQFTRFSTADGVVLARSSTHTTVYGAAGARASKALSDRASLTVSAKYLRSSDFSAPLVATLGGAPAGNITHSTRVFRLGVGIHYRVGKN